MESSDKTEALRKQLVEKRKSIYTSQLNMSIGEILNLYEDKELDLEPAFQRLFRWTTSQQTNFIESLLLGYPIPAIFVIQRESDGVWEVIDGVQRISTIANFCSNSRVSDRSKPLQLSNAKILTNLEGMYFSEDQGEPYLDKATRIDLKRESIPVILLKSSSDPLAKYELFKRLNTGGTRLSDQEIRNALILMLNSDAFEIMSEFCNNNTLFSEVINLGDRQKAERVDMEILTRFLVMKNHENIDSVPNHLDITDFIDNSIEKLFSENKINVSKNMDEFKEFIKFLGNISSDYGFRNYSQESNSFKGGFSWFIYEVAVWGLTVLNNVYSLNSKKEFFENAIKNIQPYGEFLKQIGKTNPRSIERLKLAKALAQEIFFDAH